MIRVKIASFNKSQYFFSALFFAIILNSCASLSSLDKAQDDFNKAAEMENAALINQNIYVANPPQNSDFYYESAYKEVNKALEKEAQLKKLEVYVDALSIKALCEWKLEKYNNEKAINSARVALDYMGPADKAAKDRPRDYAVLRALGALIGIEEMNVLQDSFFKAPDLSSKDAIKEYEIISNNIQNNIQDLNDISIKISKKHEVQTYLIMCQLSALKVWSDGLNSIFKLMIINKDKDENRDWYDAEKELLKEAKETAASLLESQLNNVGGKKHPVYLHWAYLLGLPT